MVFKTRSASKHAGFTAWSLKNSYFLKATSKLSVLNVYWHFCLEKHWFFSVFQALHSSPADVRKSLPGVRASGSWGSFIPTLSPSSSWPCPAPVWKSTLSHFCEDESAVGLSTRGSFSSPGCPLVVPTGSPLVHWCWIKYKAVSGSVGDTTTPTSSQLVIHTWGVCVKLPCLWRPGESQSRESEMLLTCQSFRHHHHFCNPGSRSLPWWNKRTD